MEVYISYGGYNFTVTHDRCNICMEEVIKKNYELEKEDKVPLPEFTETLAMYTPPHNGGIASKSERKDERGFWLMFCEKHMKEVTCQTAICCVCAKDNQKRPCICSKCATKLIKNTRLLEKECKVDSLGINGCMCSFCKVR